MVHWYHAPTGKTNPMHVSIRVFAQPIHCPQDLPSQGACDGNHPHQHKEHTTKAEAEMTMSCLSTRNQSRTDTTSGVPTEDTNPPFDCSNSTGALARVSCNLHLTIFHLGTSFWKTFGNRDDDDEIETASDCGRTLTHAT